MENKFPVSNVLFSPIDERDYDYSMICSATDSEVTLPDSFKLNYQFDPKNQGQVNSCFAHAASEMKEIIDATSERLSPGWIYYNRKPDDWQGVGMVARQGLAQLVSCGIPLNKYFPENVEYPEIINTMERGYNKEIISTYAKDHKSLSYFRLEVDEVKRFIYTEKKPVIACLRVYDNFNDAEKYYGVIPKPSGDVTGGHATLILGWDKNDNFIILNSWGYWGGANGYLYGNIEYEDLYRELWAVTDTPKTPIAPTPSPVTPTPGLKDKPTGVQGWKVQLGAFRIRANAEALIAELASKDIASCIVVYPDMYKVQCGFFTIKDNAIAMMNKLIDIGYKDAFIIKAE